MEQLIRLETSNKTTKYQQIVNAVTTSIRQGKLKKGDHIFSINELSDEFLLARDTVQKAYNMLRKKEVITSVKGKGFYINRTDVTTQFRILLLFNEGSNYKKQIYNAFVQTMGNKAIVDLKIYHFSTRLLENLVAKYLDDYHYFVIMTHFYDDADEIYSIIKKIVCEQLIVLDKGLPHTYARYAGVYQGFKNDIYNALQDGWHLIKKYDKITLAFPKIIPHPKEILIGFRCFCNSHKMANTII